MYRLTKPMFYCLIIFISQSLLLAQSTENYQYNITGIDSVIAFEEKETMYQMLDELSEMQYAPVKDSMDAFFLKRLHYSLNQISNADAEWLSELNKQSLNERDLFNEPVTGTIAHNLYEQFHHLSELDPQNAAIIYSRAKYLRSRYYFTQRDQLMQEYSEAVALVDENKLAEAGKKIEYYYEKDSERADLFLMGDSLDELYYELRTEYRRKARIANSEFRIEEKPEWRIYLGISGNMSANNSVVPGIFVPSEITHPPTKLYMTLHSRESIQTEAIVEYSGGLIYNINRSFFVTLEFGYSSFSNSFHTRYFNGDGSTTMGELRMRQFSILPKVGYRLMSESIAQLYLNAGIGVRSVILDDIQAVSEYHPYHPIEGYEDATFQITTEIGIDTYTSRWILIDMSFGLLFRYNLESLHLVSQSSLSLYARFSYGF